MNISTSEIVDQIFDEYIPKIVQLSSHKKETQIQLNQMHKKLTEHLYSQYYNNISRFMPSIDLDDIFLSSSPPREQLIKKKDPITPQK